MIRVAPIALAMLMTADAGAWTVKYTEHCIAAVDVLVQPPNKFKLISEVFDRDFGFVSVSVTYDTKDVAGATTRNTLRCEYDLTRGGDVAASGMLLNGKRLRDFSVEAINLRIVWEPS